MKTISSLCVRSPCLRLYGIFFGKKQTSHTVLTKYYFFYFQVSLITKIRKRIADGHRVLIHCYGGLGRAVLVAACLVMTIDEDVFTDEVQL